MIWPIPRLCSAIAIPSHPAMLRLSRTAERKASVTTAYGTEEPDETLASRPVLMTTRAREGATYFHIQSLVEASAYAAFPPRPVISTMAASHRHRQMAPPRTESTIS